LVVGIQYLFLATELRLNKYYIASTPEDGTLFGGTDIVLHDASGRVAKTSSRTLETELWREHSIS
jgi:hypothetical protein